MDKNTHDSMVRVLGDIAAERHRQVERYGLNRENADGTGPRTAWLLPLAHEPATDIQEMFRQDYEDWEAESGNPVTWVHLIREEVAEAFMEEDPERLRAELIQVAALCVSWIQNLDHRAETGDTAPALFGLDDFEYEEA